MSLYVPRNTRRKAENSLMCLLKAVFIGIVGAWLGVVIWNGTSGDVGIVTIHASARPAIVGRTVLNFPPLGSVSAKTHFGPARIDLRIDQIHIKETAEWLKQHKSPRDTAYLVENGIRQIAVRLAWMAVLVGFISALVACVLFKTGGKGTALGVVAGVLGVAVPLALAALTYNTSAFDCPEFEGEMARAPHLFNVAQQAWQNNSKIVQDIPRIASRTITLYQKLEHTGYANLNNPQMLDRVLLISDLHNNPISTSFALDVARTYGVQMVIITGDFTDLGHPLETELLAGLKKFNVPIVVVSGNHDSRAIVRVLKTIHGMTMLNDGEIIRINRLSIMGFGDPAARRANTGSVNMTSRQFRAFVRKINRRLRRSETPDILIIHNNDAARTAAGKVPIILDGHLHKAYAVNKNGSIIINPGTTGAAGIRYFSARKKPSYSAAILQFTKGSRPRLRMVDTIEMELPSGDFSVKRQTISSGMIR